MMRSFAKPVRQVLGFRRLLSSAPAFEPAAKLTVSKLNRNAVAAKYAVRGRIPTKLEQLRVELLNGDNHLPFEKIINANIGNPQQLDQKPLTFYRQVLAILQYPDLLKMDSIRSSFPEDVLKRLEILLANIGSVGAYSNSQGVPYVRKSVANFISKRDGYEASADDVFLTTGASTAVSYLLSILSEGQQTGFMIPIPQYPLYTATLALNDSPVVPYYLNEEAGWSVDTSELRTLYKQKESEGVEVRALVVINPGNPTGAILTEETIEDIFAVAAEYGLVVIADEVYQENIFQGEFISMRGVLKKLQVEHPGKFDNVQLASLHSTSKGVSGECGQRGGYMELIGFSDEVRAEILKLASISLCPVVTGQALVELMINPPKEGEPSYPAYQNERLSIHHALQERAKLLYESFNKMEGVECQKPQGAMYCFPKISIPEKAIAKAKEIGYEPDEFYCNELLVNTGICAVPGSGFGQKAGTFHVRTTFLAPGVQWIYDWESFHKKFFSEYK